MAGTSVDRMEHEEKRGSAAERIDASSERFRLQNTLKELVGLVLCRSHKDPMKSNSNRSAIYVGGLF